MQHRSPTDAVEVELIRSLFDAFVPSVIMTIGFVASGALIFAQTQDLLILVVLVGGLAASITRLSVAWTLDAEARRPDLSIDRARRLEQRFAWPYCAFAVLLGLFGFRVFQLPAPEGHMLTICMLIGYGAGVAAGIGLRPRIAAFCILVAIVPAIVAALERADAVYMTMALLSAGFVGGGIYSLRRRHDRAVKDIDLRLAFANLARKDALTALPNRIALREWYEERALADGTSELVAVHYIDLNGFKPINDAHGHPVGDALLTAVGKRISRTIRDADMAARLGGDEFAVIQYGIESDEEPRQLAERLSAAIARPFHIGGLTIKISTGLGFVTGDPRSHNLDHLLALADQALYASKRTNGVVVAYEAPGSDDRRTAA